jgi:hypothetical protein
MRLRGHFMSEMKRLTLSLPGFGGFHGSLWADLFPFARETCADRFALKEAADGLSATDFSAILPETSSASSFFTSLAECFVRRFDAETSRWLGFDLALAFSEFDDRTVAGSTADHIFATMPIRSARLLLQRSAEEGHARLIASIHHRYAPYDDVIQYPADAVAQWLAQPIERWGRTELGDLLAGFVDPDIDGRLYAEMTSEGDVPMAFEESVDWHRFSELVIARRRVPLISPIVAEMPTPPSV